MSDVVIKKHFPAVEYMPTESGDPTYFEDREINGVMYRTQNASFDGTSTWSQTEHAKPSYATTQNLDGSIGHLSMPAHTTSSWTVTQWEGNGQYGVFNVMDFGAMGNGSGDDSVAINAANAAAVAAKGGYIYLPPGTYALQSMVTLGDGVESNIPITLGGAGAGATTLVANAGINDGSSLIMVANAQYTASGSSPVQENIYIEGMTFDANASGNASGSYGPIYLNLVQNCGVVDCEIIDSSNDGIVIIGNGTAADWPSTTTINFQLLRNRINLNSATSPPYTASLPIRVEGANIGIIQGNVIGDLSNKAVNGAAIYCAGSSDIDVSDNQVAMCNNGIVSNASSDVVVSNNRILAPNGTGITTAAGSLGGTNGVDNLTITGNTIIGCVGSGIRVSSVAGAGGITTDFAVAGNVIVLDVSATGPYGIQVEASQGTVTGNTIDLSGTANTGVALDSSGPGANGLVTITGNTICGGGSSPSGTGIQFVTLAESESSNCTITGNNIINVSTSLNAPLFQMPGCVIRSNPGINPWMAAVTTPPLVNNSAINNEYPFDIFVTITGGTVTSVAINGLISGVTTGSIILPAGTNNTITVKYSGGTSWTWLAY